MQEQRGSHQHRKGKRVLPILLSSVFIVATAVIALANRPENELAIRKPLKPLVTATGQPVCGQTSIPPKTYNHVIEIWMENKDYKDVIGSPNAPFQTSLSSACATATNFTNEGIYPSLPNYIAATSGQPSNSWHSNAAPPENVQDSDNVFRQVRSSGRVAKSYQESMRENCQLWNEGTYAVRHNPAAYYVGADDRAACATDNVPFDDANVGFFADLNADMLPAYSFITPDLCNGTHDCSVQTGDKWLENIVSKIFESKSYARGDTAVIVMYDERGEGKGRYPNIWVSPSVRPGSKFAGVATHFSALRAVQQMLALPYLGEAAKASDLRPEFNL